MSSVFDSSDLKVVDELRKKLEALRLEYEQVEKSLLGAQQQLGKQAKSQKDLTKNTETLIAEEKKLQQLEKQSQAITYNTIKAQEQNKLKRAQLTEQVRRENKELQQNQTLQQRMGGAIKNSIAQIGLMVGIIGGAITGLVKFGKSIINASDALADDFQVATNQAKAAFDTFKTSLATMDFSNFFSNLKESIRLAGEYTRTMQQLEDSNRSLGIQQVKQEGNLARLKKVYQDVNLSTDKRTEALNEYKAIVLSLANTEQTNTKKAYDAELRVATQRSGLTEDQIKLFLEENDAMNELTKSALELGENQIRVGSLTGAWSLLTKTLTGDLTETAEANQELINNLRAAGIEGQKAVDFAEKLRKLSPEQIDKLTASSKAYYTSLNKFDIETVKQESLINKLEKTASAATKTNDELTESQIRLNKAKAQADMMSDEEASDEEDFKKAMQFAEDLSNKKQKEDEDYLVFKTDFYDKLNETEKALFEESLKRAEDEKEARIKAEQDVAAAKEQLNEEIAQAAKSISTSYFNAGIDENLAKFQDAQETQEEILKNRLDKGFISEAEYDKKVKALRLKTRREEARAEKKKAIFEAIINTLLAVAKALPNIPLAVLAGVIGGVQVAAISAEPLPSYFKGTKNHPGGAAVVGDNRFGGSQTEFIQLPSGEGFIARNPMIMDLPRGSQVFTENSPETKAALNQFNDSNIVGELRQLRRQMSNGYITEEGLISHNNLTNTRKILLDRRFR